MRITFLVPEYIWAPSGGIRIVYEYSNRLAARGHVVTVIHPRRLAYPPPAEPTSAYQKLRSAARMVRRGTARPQIDWHTIDSRVRLLYVPDSSSQYLPDGDALFATGWHTVKSVLAAPPAKGDHCYLIQGYEGWQGPDEQVKATWLAPLNKVVIAKWLLDLGQTFGCRDLTYIPNALDSQRYPLLTARSERAKKVAMLFSATRIKGAEDGFKALNIVRQTHPDLSVVAFGTSRRLSWIPDWVQYFQNPPQDFIVREIYNASRIYLAPSWTEGSPLPPAEAAACGCALVATDIGGFREYIEDGVTGLLSPPKNPEGLAANLCRLLNNDDERIRLAAAARERVLTFDWNQSTDLMESFLYSLRAETVPA